MDYTIIIFVMGCFVFVPLLCFTAPLIWSLREPEIAIEYIECTIMAIAASFILTIIVWSIYCATPIE